MPLVAANGVQLHVQDLGTAGPPVVMLHGLLIGSAASWYFTSAPVLARTRRVRVYDLRGHGMSELARSDYSVSAMAADLAAIAGDEPVDLVGHSWGALVALRFALNHPARLRRLVLVEAPMPPSSIPETIAFAANTDPARLVAALPVQLRVPGRRRERLVRSLERLVSQTSLVAELLAEREPDSDELTHLAPSTLLVYGDRSPCRDGGRRLAEAIPDARYTELPGGHYLHLDARDALTELIVGHLDG
ncbi:alpha/beta fold hydrolase [Skermania piniformis]|uniref:Alpha/beta hydrolase n=1 Tax=Skermania pinensis TaxID=39122 RepID=A0ABX8SBL6_9ACTN|nr:alpha/beta hydrolase [Skermania piniformis]QXQ15254.1 alpha/beta hydrolase [Skermania piniformis]